MAYLPPLNGGRLNAGIGGNTVGASTMLTGGTMVLAGGNNVTLSQNGSTISFNASFAQSAQTQSNVQAISAAGGAAATGTVVFSNSNNINFGLNGQTVTASYAGGGAGANTIGGGSNGGGNNLSGNQGYVSGSNLQMAFAGGNNITLSQSLAANNSSGTITISGPTFANSNNVAFGINNGVITASYTAGSNTFGISNIGNTSGTSGVVSGSNAGLVLSGGNNITLSQITGANSLYTVGVSGPSLVNGNGFSFGSNAGSVTASYTGIGNINVSAGGSNQTLSGLTFANSNSVAFGLSNGVITASAAPDGIQGVAAGAGAINNGTLSFVNSNGLAFGLNGSNLTGSYTQQVPFDGGMLAATSGGLTQGVAGTNSAGLALVAGSNITLSQSTDAAGATVVINGTSGGGGGAAGTISNWEPNLLQNVSLSNSSYTARYVNFFKLQVPGNVVASQLLQLISASPSTSSNSSASYYITMQAGIYTANGSTLSLITQSSGSNTFSFTAYGQSSSTNWNLIRGVSMPINVSFSGGNYWIGMWSNTTYANMTGSMYNQAVINNNYSYGGFFNQANNGTQGIQEGVGYYSTTVAGIPGAAPMSQISGQSVFAQGRIPYLNFKNTTW